MFGRAHCTVNNEFLSETSKCSKRAGSVREQLLRSPIRRTCAELRRSCVARRRKKRIVVLFPMVVQANSPRMPCQGDTASEDARERLTSHDSAQPKFHPQTN